MNPHLQFRLCSDNGDKGNLMFSIMDFRHSLLTYYAIKSTGTIVYKRV